MNKSVIQPLLVRSLAKEIEFPEILATLARENVESYHVDFLRNEARYYSKSGESFETSMPFEHGPVAGEFSAEKLDAINKRVQAKQATYSDFVKEGPAVGCAYYIVYVNGKKVRYFGRDGGEHIQDLPGAAK